MLLFFVVLQVGWESTVKLKRATWNHAGTAARVAIRLMAAKFITLSGQTENTS